MVSNLADAVAQIDLDAKSYGKILLSHAAEENISAILIGPAGGTSTRVAFRIADDDPWFECMPPPSHARQRWLRHLLSDRGLPLTAGEHIDGSFVQKRIGGPSLIWRAHAESPESTIMLTRGDDA